MGSEADALRARFPDLDVRDGVPDRIAYARDAWPRHFFDIRSGRIGEHSPAAIAYPESTEDVRRLVLWARETHTPIVPFGAGSGVTGGILPTRETVVVDMKRMTRIRALDERAPSVTVEAGALGLHFEEELGRRGFTLGHFPSSIMCSTVGGWIAARSAGQCSSRYGKIEDMIVDLECVTGRGDVVTLPMRRHGASLVPLVVGSEGTLAIVTAATLRLHPAPQHRTFASFRFGDTETGWHAMQAMFQRGLRPAVLRLYDPFDAMIAKRNASKKAHAQKRGEDGLDERSPRAVGMRDFVLRQVMKRPGPLNRFLRSKRGEELTGGAMLVAIFEGDPAEAARNAEEALRIVLELGGRDSGPKAAERWFSTRYDVSFRMAPIYAGGSFVDTYEVAATWSRLGAVYDAVRRALEPHVFVMAHMSHAYPDGACIYFSFAGRGDNAVYRQLWDAQTEHLG